MQLIQQWKTSTTCIGQSFQTFIRQYIGCSGSGIKNEEGRQGQGTSRKEQGRPGTNRAISAHPGEKLDKSLALRELKSLDLLMSPGRKLTIEALLV